MESRNIRFEEGEAHRSREFMPENNDSELRGSQPAGELEPAAPTNGSTDQQLADQEVNKQWLPGAIPDSFPALPSSELLRSCTPCNRAKVTRCLSAEDEWDSSEVINNTAVTPLVPGERE
ncbi:hypothetical protein C8J55DRAFT_567776 [Lentinula edodes]|uniref:Uncharacterized protein n=1 Tax=Lentinula lateritia TaxID=40482 RepID=A0A9W8ZQX2_9AGAR|nr:hypothetical protein C8J55DRAFT_567776 [Lentinula edodes]